MPTKYGDDIRAQARRLRLAGRSAREIADELDIAQADTVRTWAKEGGWEQMRDEIERQVTERSADELGERRKGVDLRHDRLAEALESAMAKLLRARSANGDVALSGNELRALASTLATTQGIRRLALGLNDKESDEGSSQAQPPQIRLIRWRGESDEREGAADTA